MIILDTNVISALMRARPEKAVLRWLDGQPPESIWTTAITLYELRFGIEKLEDGPRREALRASLNHLLLQVLDGRYLNFDAAAAEETAVLAVEWRRRHRTVDFRDTQIAGIARARKATLATRNRRDFADAGIKLVNPWTE